MNLHRAGGTNFKRKLWSPSVVALLCKVL